MSNLAIAHDSQERHAEAAALHAQALAISQRVLGGEHPETLKAMGNLALALRNQGKLAEAIALQAESLEKQKRVRGAEHPDTLHSMNNLALMYGAQGKFAEAAALHETLEIRKRVLGAEHPETLWSMNNLAMAVLGSRNRVLGTEHPDTLRSMSELAGILERLNDFPKAEAVHRELLATRVQKYGVDSTNAAAARANLGKNLIDQRQFAAAEPELRQALAVRTKKMPDNWHTFNTRSLLGTALAGQRKFAEAESYLVSGYEGMKSREARIAASDIGRLNEAFERLMRAYIDWGHPEKAMVWREKVDAVEARPSAALRNVARE